MFCFFSPQWHNFKKYKVQNGPEITKMNKITQNCVDEVKNYLRYVFTVLQHG